MHKFLILVLPLTIACAGCTTMSLARRTLNQSQSATDYRYQATLHSLATVAADPGMLPSYSLLSSGLTSITDTGIVSPATTWVGSSVQFFSQALTLTGSHVPSLQWTVSPVADFTQLEAMRCACRWVLAGPDHAGPDCLHVLADPEKDLTDGPHFGVLDRLTSLPNGWLHVGGKHDVPSCAPYKDHCGDTWVWIMPDGLEGLSGFTLVLQDIATLNVAPTDGSVPTNIAPPVLVTLWVVDNVFPPVKPVFIDIKTENGSLKYVARSTNPGVKVDPQAKVDPRARLYVTVGQTVVWTNLDACPHSATNSSGNLFDTGSISPGTASKGIVFDAAMYTGAGGNGDQAVEIKYGSTVKGDNLAGGVIFLNPDPNTSLYSPTLVTRVDRVVKPDCKSEIEKRISDGISPVPSQPVPIEWNEWMAMTTPFQGQRTSVKPGSSTTVPVTVPAKRLLLPATKHLAPPVPVLIPPGITVVVPRGRSEELPVPKPESPDSGN